MFSKSSKKSEKGQGLVEYAIILALVAIVVIVAMTALGPRIQDAYLAITVTLDCSPETVDAGNQAILDSGAGDQNYTYPMANKALDDCSSDLGN